MRSLHMRGALRRRWYLLVAGLLVTGALAAAAFAAVGPSQEIRSSALLLPPDVSVVSFPAPESPGNPFLRLDGIDPALSVLITKMMADDTSDRMLDGTSQSDYVVAEDPLSQAPVIVATVSGKDPDEAEVVLDRISEEMPQVLDSLQADSGIRERARITLVPLVRDAEPTVVWGGLLRLLIVVIGVGLVGTLLLTGLWDAVARSRAARGRVPEEPGSPSTPEDAERSRTEDAPGTAAGPSPNVERPPLADGSVEKGQEPDGEVTTAKARV